MLTTLTRTRKRMPQPLRERRPYYPTRALHLIDVENLVGAGLPLSGQVAAIRTSYARRVGFGPADHVVLACNHRALADAALGWPDVRYRIRSGPDGADLELLDVIESEHVAERFTHVMIGSGDGIFADSAARLADANRQVTVVSRRDALSTRLRLAACDVVYIDATEPPARGSFPAVA